MNTASKQYHILRRCSQAKVISRSLSRVGLGLFLVLVTSGVFYTRAYMPARVYAATSSTLNFQARLQSSAGSAVSDGNYSIEFKLYNANSGGAALWTETQPTVRTVNGYMTVSLGSVAAFPSTIDWSQEHWLTMNVNGDGEMNPRLKLTAVPYAFRAGQADSLTNGGGTITANDLIQKTPVSLQEFNSLVAGIRLNQTGTGGLLQLQGDGADVFTVSKGGLVYAKGSIDIDGDSLDIGTALQKGSLILQNGDSKTGTLQAGSLSANRTYTLPDADGTICLTTTCSGGGGGPVNAFVQDGNSFGTTATLGTNDLYGLAFETSGTTRLLIDAGGNIGIGTSGTPSQLVSIGGTTGNFTVDATGAVVAAGLTSNGALSVISGGASITGGLNNNNSGITNAGSITGIGSDITAVSGLTIASGGSGNLILNAASGLAVLGATTLQTTDSLLLDLSKATDTALSLQNSGTGSTNLNLIDGGLQTGGTLRLTNAGALQNITGLTVSSGDAIFNGNVTIGDTAGDRLMVTSQILGANALVFQGATDNGFSTALSVADPTANNTITLPDGSGTLVLDSRSIQTAIGSGLTGGGTLGSDLNLSLDINGLTTKTNVNPGDYIAVHDATTSSIKKISRNDFLQGLIGALIYRGTWDASANTPTLADNTGTNGDMYVVAVAGTQNFGQGPSITFGVGDFVIYNGTEWERAPSSADVTSVFGRTGAVTAQNGDYTATQITNTPAGTIAATNVQGALNELANEKLGSLNGLTGISQTFANDTNVTITSSGSTHTLGWSGQLSVVRGGTGAASFTTNGVLYGNNTGALQVTAAGTGGQILLANSSGVPTFTTLSGDITLDSSGVANIGADKVTLGTDTTGNYLASLGTLTGLTLGGTNGVEGGMPTLAVNYGSAANTATQGNTTITIAAGTNLGGGGTITLGAGGTVTLNTINSPTFSTSVTSPIFTSTAGLTLSSGGTGDILLNSASNKIIIDGTDTTLERTGTGSYTIDLKDNAATSLVLGNSTAGGSSVANLNLIDGSLQIAGTTVIGNDRALQNLAGITNVGAFTTSGGIASLNASSNFATNINTGTSAGTVTIGGGAAPLVINSTAFDVTSAGALSGITTISLSGAITGATAANTINGLVINSGALSSVASITGSGALTIASGGTGALTLDSASNTLVLAATDNTILRTAAGTTTIDLVNAGTTTLSVINSNASNVANINVEGAYQVNGTSGVASLICSSGQYVGNGVNVRGGLITAGTCQSDGLSDMRLKKNITALDDDVLSRLKFVNTVSFDFKCDNAQYASSGMDCFSGRQTGVIAQELAQVFPDLVYQDENGYYNVKYQGLSIYTLKAVNELAAQVEAIKNSSGAASNEVSTGGVLRLDKEGRLQNINGIAMLAGGASVVGGINNNGGGLVNTGAIAGATIINAQAITLDAAAAGNMLELKKDGNGVFTIFNEGALQLKLNANQAFAVKNKEGKDYFNINTNGGLVSIGSGVPDEQAVLLVLDSINMDGDPAGVNGAQYYNAARNKFRCYQDNKWQDCLPVAATAEYILFAGSLAWNQPAAEEEFPGEHRAWTDLSQAREYRLTARVGTVGAPTADCRLQYAFSDDGPWFNLNDGTKSELPLDASGTIKTEWSGIASEARKEVLMRIMCKQGNYDNLILAGSKPQISGIKLQIR